MYILIFSKIHISTNLKQGQVAITLENFAMMLPRGLKSKTILEQHQKSILDTHS